MRSLSQHWIGYLVLTLACLVVQGLFSMLEMACVSFNKVRLLYFVSRRQWRARALNFLLHRPAMLFGAILIVINFALLLGSEASRRFYESIHVSPDWTLFSQVLLVLVFAEMAPLLAGRRYAESAVMLGIPFVFVFAMLLLPITWLLDALCRGVGFLMGSPKGAGPYLSREELQKAIEEREEGTTVPALEKHDLNSTLAYIFSLRNKRAKEVMAPLSSMPMAVISSTIGELRQLLQERYIPFVPLFHQDRRQIVAIAYPRDLLRLSPSQRARDYARPPWFITEELSIMGLLEQFRKNNQSVAVVLNREGLAVGLLTLDEIIDEIFERPGDLGDSGGTHLASPFASRVVLDRTLSAQMPLSEFNRQFHVHLTYGDAQTLEEVMTLALDHSPKEGESVRIDQFELTVEEASLFGIKSISVHTV